MIDQEDWRVFKKKDKADLEPNQVGQPVEVNEIGEEITEVLLEETEFERVETMTKSSRKRQNDTDDQPSRKKKKYENIMNWGEAAGMEEAADPGAWLVGMEEGTSGMMLQDLSIAKEPKRKKMKQMELEFVKRVAED